MSEPLDEMRRYADGLAMAGPDVIRGWLARLTTPDTAVPGDLRADRENDKEREAFREKAIAFGVHDAADLIREWGHEEIADRLRDEALARYGTVPRASGLQPLADGAAGAPGLTATQDTAAPGLPDHGRCCECFDGPNMAAGHEHWGDSV